MCVFVWLFDTDCCCIVFERLRFQLPYSYCSIFFVLLVFPPFVSLSISFPSLDSVLFKSFFFLAFVSFLTKIHTHTYSLTLLYSQQSFLYIFFCLHHFSLLFIFSGLLLFTMLALDHIFTCCKWFFFCTYCCVLTCLLARLFRIWYCCCWFALVQLCIFASFILIFWSLFLFLEIERAFARFHVCIGFFFLPFLPLSFSSPLYLPIQFKLKSFFSVFHSVCVWFSMIVYQCVFQLDCKAHIRAILIFVLFSIVII